MRAKSLVTIKDTAAQILVQSYKLTDKGPVENFSSTLRFLKALKYAIENDAASRELAQLIMAMEAASVQAIQITKAMDLTPKIEFSGKGNANGADHR